MCLNTVSKPATGFEGSTRGPDTQLFKKITHAYTHVQTDSMTYMKYVSGICFYLYYFYNIFPLTISNHNAFYNFLLGYNALHTLDKMDRNRLLKDNTSLEAVTLIEKDDNEVFKLLNYEYI